MPIVPGLLLQFPRDLEEEWRLAYNETCFAGDIFWTIGIFIVISKTYLRQESLTIFGLCWYAASCASLTFSLLALQNGRKDLYVRYRIRLLVFVRLVRIIGLVLFIAPAQNTIWPPTQDAMPSCVNSIIFSQSHSIMYLLSRSVAYPLPLIHQTWILGISTAVALVNIPQRCASDVGIIPGLGACSLAWAGKLRQLNKLWVFSLVSEMTVESPRESCIRVQAMLLIVLGALIPFLTFCSFEERWRLDWLSFRGGTPFISSPFTYILFNCVFIILSGLITYQAIDLYL